MDDGGVEGCGEACRCYVLPLFFVSQTYLFFSHNYSSFPCHWPTDHTCLHNCFLPSTSLDFYDSFLLTCIVKTGFTLEVTPRKSRVEGGWDLASPYVVHPCLHAQWSRILGLVGGGDKDLSRGVNKPVGVELSRLSE